MAGNIEDTGPERGDTHSLQRPLRSYTIPKAKHHPGQSCSNSPPLHLALPHGPKTPTDSTYPTPPESPRLGCHLLNTALAPAAIAHAYHSRGLKRQVAFRAFGRGDAGVVEVALQIGGVPDGTGI